MSKPHIGIVNFEKRRHPRFNIDLPLEYYRVDSSTSQTGRAINASEGGLLVYFPEPMEIGQQLQLKLFFASGKDLNAIQIRSEVVWIDMHLGEGWGDYRCGLKFIDIAPEDINKLKNFLNSLSQ